jgi:hypothetical protein
MRTAGLKGPADACVYRWRGHPVLVAHYLTADGMFDIGHVALDQGFDDVTPAS